MKQTDLEFITSYILNNLNKGTEQLPLTWKMTDEVFNGLSDEGFNELQAFYNEEWSVIDIDTAIDFVNELDSEDKQIDIDFFESLRKTNSEAVIGYYLGFYDMRVSDYLDLLARFIERDEKENKENA